MDKIIKSKEKAEALSIDIDLGRSGNLKTEINTNWQYQKRADAAEIKMFKQAGSYVVYLKALNLSGYGPRKKDAIKMFKVVFKDYCKSQLKACKKSIAKLD